MITSKQNSQILAAKKLKEKKGRQEGCTFLIEGAKLVADAFSCGLEVVKIFVTPERANEFENYAGKCEIVLVSEAVIKAICDAETNQGVAAIIAKPQAEPYDKKSALVLDRLQDPKNLGSILRTASATGVNTVFLIDCADPFSPKALRAGMSGQFLLNLIEADVKSVKEQTKGMQVLAADMCGENIFGFKAEEDFVLVLGNEGGGISGELRSVCTHTVSVPMKNNFDSLNVAVACGILLYQLISGIKN